MKLTFTVLLCAWPFPTGSGRTRQGEAAGAHVDPGGAGAAEDAHAPHTFPLRLAAPRGAGANPVTPTQHSRPEVRVTGRDKV